MSGPGDHQTFDANGVMASVYDPALRALRISGSGASGAPANASYVTMVAESGLSNESVLGSAVIMTGTLGARPAAATGGRLYAATDNGILYRDTGSTWVAIGSSLTGAIIIDPASSARNLIQSTADATELTLKAFAGQTAPILDLKDSAGAEVALFNQDGTGQMSWAKFTHATPHGDPGLYATTSTDPTDGGWINIGMFAAGVDVEFGGGDDTHGVFCELSAQEGLTGAGFIQMYSNDSVGYAGAAGRNGGTDFSLEAKADPAQTTPLLRILGAPPGSLHPELFKIDVNGTMFSDAHAAPADADLNNSSFALWWKDTVAANALNVDGKDSAGTVVTRAYAVQPIDSHTATVAFGSLAVGTPKQNTLGYDILVMGTVDITAATGGSLKLGTGPTSTPTTDPITASITTAALSVVGFSAVVPNGYYISLASAGTITLSSPVVIAVPV